MMCCVPLGWFGGWVVLARSEWVIGGWVGGWENEPLRRSRLTLLTLLLSPVPSTSMTLTRGLHGEWVGGWVVEMAGG